MIWSKSGGCGFSLLEPMAGSQVDILSLCVNQGPFGFDTFMQDMDVLKLMCFAPFGLWMIVDKLQAVMGLCS